MFDVQVHTTVLAYTFHDFQSLEGDFGTESHRRDIACVNHGVIHSPVFRSVTVVLLCELLVRLVAVDRLRS